MSVLKLGKGMKEIQLGPDGKSIPVTPTEHWIEESLSPEDVNILMEALKITGLGDTRFKMDAQRLWVRLRDTAFIGFGRARPWTIRFKV